MTSQERVMLALQHREADRVAVSDSPWETTEQRWHREGLPEGVTAAQHFNFELWGFWGDNSLQLEGRVMEETDEWVTRTNTDGAVVRNWKHATSTPELMDFAITTRALWEQYKPRLTYNDTRVDWEGARKGLDDARAKGLFTYLGWGPGFTKICNLVGPERCMMAMVEDPEWVRDMFLTDAQVCAAIAEEVLGRGLDVDAGWIFDDLGFKHKGFFSPATYRELLMPAHKLICDVFKAHGKPMILHSCGYVTEFVPLFIEAGFDCLQPLEVKAGNDLVALKQQYGDRLAFMGGIDVRAMAHPDPAVIEREIATKVPAAKQGGGYIFYSDHSVPDDVSFAQYCRVMELAAHYGRF
jgi:uroporphyrinogen decarboxylase